MTKTQELLQMKDEIARLKQDNDDLHDRVVFLEKELSKEKDANNTWYKANNTSQAKLEEIETFINELPGVISEFKEDGYTKIPMIIRLALWIAGRKNDKQQG